MLIHPETSLFSGQSLLEAAPGQKIPAQQTPGISQEPSGCSGSGKHHPWDPGIPGTERAVSPAHPVPTWGLPDPTRESLTGSLPPLFPRNGMLVTSGINWSHPSRWGGSGSGPSARGSFQLNPKYPLITHRGVFISFPLFKFLFYFFK